MIFFSKKLFAILLSFIILATTSCKNTKADTKSQFSEVKSSVLSCQNEPESNVLIDMSLQPNIQISEPFSSCLEKSSIEASRTISSSASITSKPTIENELYPKPYEELKKVLDITPKITYISEFDYSRTVKAIFYTGLDYEGKKTRVFAYIGFPADATKSKKVPAVVCVHGGAGQAFPQWVQKWVDKGYAAIAMDNYGNMPVKENGNISFERDPNGASSNDAGFRTINNRVDQQWIYYGIGDAILANTIMQNDARVKSEKIGLTGISWGGIIAGITAGVDNRFAFAIPIYGCGYLNESHTYFKDLYNDEKVTNYWGVENYIPFIEMPTLWINSNFDHSFSLNCFSKTASNTKGAYLCIKPEMQHDYVYGWSSPEIYKFADSICNGEDGLVKIKNHPTKSMGASLYFQIEVPSDLKVSSVDVIYITEPLKYKKGNGESLPSLKNEWKIKSGNYSSGKVTVDLPNDVNSYYINICASGDGQSDFITSTKLIELK